MKYEYEMLKVGDADAIVIRHFINDTPYVILIDAGNVNDGSTIKKHLQTYFGSTTIDLAICTHPDDDHKGGFFTLLTGNEVTVKEFWLTDPAVYLDKDDYDSDSEYDSAVDEVRVVWSNKDNTLNLVELALDKCEKTVHVIEGDEHESLPIKIVAPDETFYCETAKEMLKLNGVDDFDDSSRDEYNELYEMDEEDAKSVIDAKDKNDPSPYNASSLVVLYHPDNKKFLFCGDADTTSLQIMLDHYPEIRNVDMLKVPHHGSKRNLNTTIIEALAPKKSYISAAGNAKHPDRSVVYWLSKYGPVYSTHTANGYVHCGTRGIERAGTRVLSPIKEKQE